MRLLSAIILVLVFAIGAVSLPVQAQQPSLYLQGEEYPGGPETCGIRDNGLLLVRVVAAGLYAGVSGVRFAAPIPQCVPGATWLFDDNEFPKTTGNSQVGVEVDFGQCMTSQSVTVMTMWYGSGGLTQGCCIYPILPYPDAQTDQVEFIDCSGQIISGTAHSNYVSITEMLPPLITNRTPVDGASNCALDTDFRWKIERCDCIGAGAWVYIYLGTSPNPPPIGMITPEDPEDHYDPGPLQPGTTYYWKIRAYAHDETITPVWSFTTIGGVPVEATTWGRIKNLYAN
jgi:hypothetical protein